MTTGQETTGILVDGSRYRVTPYLLEVTAEDGMVQTTIDVQNITGIQRVGQVVTVKRKKERDVILTGATLDDAGRLEGALRPAGAGAGSVAAQKKKGAIMRVGMIGCGGLLALTVLIVVVVALAGESEDDEAPTTVQGQSGSSGATPAVLPTVGEPLRLPKDNWTITVTNVRTSSTVKGVTKTTQTALGVYVLVDVKMENSGKDARELGGNRFTLKDDKGRTFKYFSDGTIGNGQGTVGAKINPGLSGDGTIVFDVPTDATGLILETVSGGKIAIGNAAQQ
ncbi:MAG TPA: DUF4352 domain-containing protein [Chloroflexota bacterium]|nr:DUF4352 domain-containing protein [Chloroflexota bacterium]